MEIKLQIRQANKVGIFNPLLRNGLKNVKTEKTYVII